MIVYGRGGSLFALALFRSPCNKDVEHIPGNPHLGSFRWVEIRVIKRYHKDYVRAYLWKICWGSFYCRLPGSSRSAAAS